MNPAAFWQGAVLAICLSPGFLSHFHEFLNPGDRFHGLLPSSTIFQPVFSVFRKRSRFASSPDEP